MEWTTKQHDTKPIEIRCERRNSSGVWQSIDLTGFTSVKFLMRDLDGNAVVSADMSVDDAASGAVSYTFQPADTDTAGEFHAEVQLVDAAGIVETVPAGGYICVLIVADLGD